MEPVKPPYEEPGLDPVLRAALADELILWAARHFHVPLDPITRPDWYDQCRKHLEGAARTWNPARSSFKTHAYSALRHALHLYGETPRPGVRAAERDWADRTSRPDADPDEQPSEKTLRVREAMEQVDERTRVTLEAWMSAGQCQLVAAEWLKLPYKVFNRRLNTSLGRLRRVLEGKRVRPCPYAEDRGFTLDGVRRTVKEWARLAGVGETTIRHRIARGWPLKRALTEGRNVGQAKIT